MGSVRVIIKGLPHQYLVPVPDALSLYAVNRESWFLVPSGARPWSQGFRDGFYGEVPPYAKRSEAPAGYAGGFQYGAKTRIKYLQARP